MYTKFYEDKRKEELFGKWLDKHFYALFSKRVRSINRVTEDEKLQKVGVDVILEITTGKLIHIDEKAALHYINENIPTFAFEIQNRTSGAQGWLFNKKYITDYYLLAWPFATEISVPSEEAFTKSEIMTIERAKVIKLLSDRNLSEERILSLVDYYLPKVTKSNFKFPIAKGISLYYTENLAEKPVNVVIHKELLKKYAKTYRTYI